MLYVCVCASLQPLSTASAGHWIDVVRSAGGLVNGTRCRMKSLSWRPGVQHDVITKLRQGTLRPRSDGKPYLVPCPYTVNVEVTNKDGSATPVSTFKYIMQSKISEIGLTGVAPKSVIPVAVSGSDGKKGSGFKTRFQQPLPTVHHHVDLTWAFTDFKVQGLTWKEGEKLILSLNKSTATKNLNIKTISVCLSRVTRLEDLRILPIDLDDPESPETEHLRKLRQDKYVKYWMSGYKEDGTWDANELRSMHAARRRALKVKFANDVDDLEKLTRGDGNYGLTYWLGRFDIRVRTAGRSICYRVRFE